MSESTRGHGRPAVFLDLNGTLVEPVRVTTPDEYALLPGATDAVALLNGAGFVCPVVTVQTRIAKGLFSEAHFRAWFAVFRHSLARQGAHIVGPYLCPHSSTAACACAKPQATLHRRAVRDHGIDHGRSYIVGDTADDVRAAASLGAKGCLVLTGWGRGQVDRISGEATHVGADVLAVARWIVADQLLSDQVRQL